MPTLAEALPGRWLGRCRRCSPSPSTGAPAGALKAWGIAAPQVSPSSVDRSPQEGLRLSPGTGCGAALSFAINLSFRAARGEHRSRTALIQANTQRGHELRISVIAGRIETEAQRRLIGLRRDVGQDDLVGRPAPLDGRRRNPR